MRLLLWHVGHMVCLCIHDPKKEHRLFGLAIDPGTERAEPVFSSWGGGPPGKLREVTQSEAGVPIWFEDATPQNVAEIVRKFGPCYDVEEWRDRCLDVPGVEPVSHILQAGVNLALGRTADNRILDELQGATRFLRPLVGCLSEPEREVIERAVAEIRDLRRALEERKG